MSEENKMGTMPIPKLILSTSLPLMVSLFVNQLYNLVDSIFVAHINEDALTAVSLAAPLQMIMIALGCGLAVGLNARISVALGEKNKEQVEQTASAAMVMAIGTYLINALVCLLAAKSYFSWQADGNEVVMQYGISYIQVCMLLSFGQMTQWVFDRFLIATGKSSLFLVTLGTASVVNLILDPILIFGYFGMPVMGTAGAALATVLGQMTGGLLGIILNVRYNKEIPIHFTFHISGKSVLSILRVGIPTAIMQGIMSVMGIIINTILYQFSSTAVAVYGIIVKLQNLVLIGVNGMNNALIPIIGYNYGAKKKQRIYDTVRYTFLYAVVIMSVILIALELLPGPILSVFNASEHMMEIGIPAIRIMAVSFLISSAGIIFAAIYQGFGNGSYSMYLVCMRQGILLLPFLLLAGKIQNLPAVWLAFVLAETLAVPFGFYFYKKINRQVLSEMQ